MRATRIATRRDHKQEASFPQAIFLFRTVANQMLPEGVKRERVSF
jgi:hypothetical protein